MGKTTKNMLSCDMRHGFCKATRHFKANRECQQQLAHLQTVVSTVHGHSIKCLCMCRLKVTVKEKVHHVFFSVVDEGLESLLGGKASEELKLVRQVYHISTAVGAPRDHTVQSFADFFKGFGVLPFTYKIQLKENAQPVVHTAQ